MSLSSLESLLRELATHVPRSLRMDDSGAIPVAMDAKPLVTDIAGVCTSLEQTDLEYAASLLFKSECSLIIFLRHNLNTKEASIQSAQTEALRFLADFISKQQKVLQPYCYTIGQCCFALGYHGSGRVKSAAIETLIVLMDQSKSQLDVGDLNVSEFFAKFSHAYTLNVTKTSNSTKASILDLLGTIMLHHPTKVSEPQVAQTFRWCLGTLQHQLFTSKEAENNLVTGALRGLSKMVESSHNTIERGSEDAQQLYKCIRRLFDVPEHLSRYDAPIAALLFLEKHASLFGQWLVDDCKWLYEHLRVFIEHQNRDISKAGYSAINEFMRQVSYALAKQAEGPSERAAFQYLLGQFDETTRTDPSQLSLRDLSIAIRGIGYLSTAFSKHLSVDEVEILKDRLVSMSSWFYSDYNANRENFQGQIPAFIQAYTSFASNIETLSASLMSTIVKMVESFMYNYARLSSITRPSGIYAIQRLLRVLYDKGEGTLRGFLSDFFYKALTYTCSDVTNDQSAPVYMDFIYFWESVLCDKYDKNMKKKDDDQAAEIQKQRQRIYFDEFLSSFLKIIDAFDLEYKDVTDKEQRGGESADQRETYIATSFGDLKATNTKDFMLFHNMVQFWCILLPRLPSQRLKDWFHISASAIISHSIKRQLVSGFYKMLATMLSVADQHGFFQGYKELYTKEQQQQGDHPDDISKLLPKTKTDLYSAFLIIRDFLKEVWQRQQLFKDELLAACLQLMLSYPLAFFDVRELVPPIQSALKMGVTFYPMATIALDALDKIVDPPGESSTTQDLSFLVDILPLLNEYLLMDLRVKANTYKEPKKKARVLTTAERKRHEIHFRATSEILGATTIEDVSLGDIQLRVMRFLGKIGGISKLMIKAQMDAASGSTAGSVGQQLVAWDPKRRLHMGVPFPKAKISLSFDNLLPRICELAELSPDRQVKVAACELLHALVIFMIGDTAFRPPRITRNKDEEPEAPYIRLYRRIFPILLRLAVDIDLVPRKMFSDLNAQVIHWFTNNTQYENQETVTLLSACLDAACSEDSGLRSYGAECVNEFVKWTIKQQSVRQESPLNIRSLLKRLYNMTSHPSAMQRLGACMVFNKIYRIFREEPQLVSEYTLELLYHLFFCLKLAEDDLPYIGTREQAKQGIRHIHRILERKATVFLEQDETRRRVPGIKQADLQSMVAWAFGQSGELQREYARECMHFFTEFVKKLPNIKDGRQWLEKALSKDNDLVIRIFEPQRLRQSEFTKAGSTLLWLRQVTCSLDGYIWIIENNMMDANIIFEQQDSVLLEKCVYFLEHKPSDLLKIQGSDSAIERTRAQSLYAYGSYQIVRMLTLAARSKKSGPILDNSGLLLHPELIEAIAQMLMLPEQYVQAAQAEKSTISTLISTEKVRRAAKENIQIMATISPSEFLPRIAKACASIQYSHRTNLAALQLDQCNMSDMMQIVEGVKILQELNLLENVCNIAPRSSGNHPTAIGFCTDLFGKFRQLHWTEDPASIQLLGNMLKIAFHEETVASQHAKELLFDIGENDTERLAVYQKFGPYMNDCFAIDFKIFAPLMIDNISDSFIHTTMLGLAKHLQRNQKTRRKEVVAFMNELVREPGILQKLLDEWKDLVNLPDLIALFKSILGADVGLLSRNKKEPVFSVFCQGLLTFLRNDVPLAIKMEAFDLLPAYICIESDYLEQIKQALKETVNRQFPPSSKDLDPSSEMYNTYITALDKLLALMNEVYSEIIFETLLPIFIQEEDHVHAKAIKEAISNFAKNLGRIRFETVTERCFGYFMDRELDMLWRRNVVELLISLLQKVPQDYMFSFYKRHVSDIMGILNQEELRRGTDKEICVDLDERYCGFRLMGHTLYSRADYGQQIHGTTSELAMHYEKDGPSANGTKLTNDLLNDYIRSKTPKDPRETPVVLESRRRYQQAAYNAIAKAIDRTQSKPKIFAKALFADPKQQPLWQNIVDVDGKLDLKDQFTERMSKKNIEDFRARSGFRASASNMTNDQYMKSMQLSKSSLAEPSFSQMVLEATGQQIPGKETESLPDDPMEIDSEVQEEVQMDEDATPEDEYELDEINKNPCMETMVTIIKRLHNVIAKPEMYTSGMPEWMTALSKVFNAADTPLNVQVYIARLICNCKYAFAPYAAYWIRPIMKLALKGNTFGAPINYLVQDLVVLVIVWGEQVTFKDDYDDRLLISDFVHYLIKNTLIKENSGVQELRVIKFRVYLVKKLFDLWGKLVIVPTDIILDLATRNQKSRENLAGLQFGGMFLAHDCELYYDGPEANLRGLTEEAFYNKLAINFHHKYRDVVGDAAEVFAWSIELKRKKGQPTDYLEKLLKSKLTSLDPQVGQGGDDARFLACLTRIQIHCRDITEQYMNKVLRLLPHVYGNAQVMALQVIGFAIDKVEEPFVDLMKNKALLKMLKHANDQAQSILLGILIKIAPTLSPEQVESILPTLTNVFEKHANGECRSMYYTFLQTVNDNLMDTPTPLRSSIKACLLRGLTDQSEAIREGLAAYLRKIFDLNDNVYDRLKAVLSMYAPEVEDVYILYSIHLLLEGTKEAQDFDKPLFDAPLPEAHFDDEDQQIDTSWHYNASMTPMFVLSQEVRPPRPRATDQEGLIRATQTQFEFSLTQSVTGNTLASSYAPPPPRTSGPSATQSTFGTQMSQSSASQGSMVKGNDPYKSLHMRMVKQSKDETNKHFRSMHDKDARTRIREEKQRRQAEEKRVHLLRSYRVGELPDVQIKYKDLIVPLQTLGCNDNETARLLFSDLVVAITEQEPSAPNEEKKYREHVLELVRKNLFQSIDSFPPAIGSFLRICYDLDDNQLESTLINSICEKSYNQHIGIALLEKQGILGIAPRQDTKKKRTSKSQEKLDVGKKHWINLALLYRSIDEPEIFQHLYQSYVATQQLPKDAIDAEISGRFVEACNLFAESHDKYSEGNPEESFLWVHERMKCFEQLLQWQDIAEAIKPNIGGGYELIWDLVDKDDYMEYFLRSFTKLRDGWNDEHNNLIEWTDDNPNPVYQFLASAMTIPDRQDYLLRNFACEVSINAIVEKEFDRAGYYVRNAYDAFLSTWTTLHPLAHGSRMAQLINLERATEMEGFLDVMSDFQRSTGDPSKMTKYLQSLLVRYPNAQLDAMDAWDDVIDSRNVMVEELERLCEDRQIVDVMGPKLFDCRKQSILTMMAAARTQGNASVAMSHLGRLDDLGISGRERGLVGLQNEITLQEFMVDGRKKAHMLARMVANIIKDEHELQPSEDLYYEYQFAAAHVFDLARLTIQQDPNAFKTILSNSAFKKLHESRNFKDATTMANYLGHNGYAYIRDACGSSVDAEDPLMQAKCSWKFAEYCDNVMRANDVYTDTQVNVPIEYTRIVIQGYFSSMEAGNHQAIERFPRMLELIERYPEVGSVFKERAEAFEQVWMYIRWIPQMVAILDRPIALNIFPALHKLARAYPNALYYPFTISNEHYSSMGDQLPKENRQEIDKLAAAIRSPLMEKLNFELRRLGNPMTIAKDFVDIVSGYFNDPSISIDAVKEAYRELYDLVLDRGNPEIGEIPKAFATSHGSLFTDTFGENGSKLEKLKKADFQKFRGAFEKVLQRDRNKTPRTIKSLKAHSPWLAKFHGSNFDEQLEIPGQYSGKSRPDPAAHAKIISFDERLLPQSSLRRPKRLTMNGSDERPHNFLVKEGEDLRLDQRIQQLFGVMNEILAKDPYCAKHGVSIRTYNVVPMTTSVGMIEWVNDTIPLKECVSQGVYGEQIKAAYNNYRRYYERDVRQYVTSIKTPRKDIVNRFEDAMRGMDSSTLRQYLLQMASSPEAFLLIRKGFINSLAAISISGYILGIGDRHMENFLVDKKSGQMISIDFGHAFGSATELLPVPEMMPFRLTKCLTGTLEPLGLGALELVMTHVLQSLHQNRDTLLNVMDVFIKEPLLDWRKQAIIEMTTQRSTNRSSSTATATKSAQATRSNTSTGGGAASGEPSSSETTSISDQIEWFPQQKLDAARKKLNLENPGYTMAASIRRNKRVEKEKLGEKFAALALGDPDYNYRATIDQECPSIRDQVRCLVDIATDPAILGRTWVGWMPFC